MTYATDQETDEHFANIRKFKGVERVDIEVDEDVLISIFGREKIAEHIKEAKLEKRNNHYAHYSKNKQTLTHENQLPEEGIEEGIRLWYDFIRVKILKIFK